MLNPTQEGPPLNFISEVNDELLWEYRQALAAFSKKKTWHRTGKRPPTANELYSFARKRVAHLPFTALNNPVLTYKKAIRQALIELVDEGKRRITISDSHIKQRIDTLSNWQLGIFAQVNLWKENALKSWTQVRNILDILWVWQHQKQVPWLVEISKGKFKVNALLEPETFIPRLLAESEARHLPNSPARPYPEPEIQEQAQTTADQMLHRVETSPPSETTKFALGRHRRFTFRQAQIYEVV
ncbi:hypothetical protein JCM3765_005788 [Sporobolomyces pararoseus]